MQSANKTVVILGTGGTIAGASVRPGDDSKYLAAQWGVEQLVAAVPGLTGPLECEQVAQIDSKDMDPSVWHRLALRVSQHLVRPDVAGVVVTHGTDTLEETAYFLHHAVVANKPVVLTAAMRPATSAVADGPANLRDAVTLARDWRARGVLAVLAGVVHAGERVRKVHPTRLDAFGSGELGPVARMAGDQVAWITLPTPAPPTSAGALAFVRMSADERGAWPRVELVCSHAGADGFAVRALCAAGVAGLVVVCTGNGTLHHGLAQALRDAQSAGVRVLRSTRCTEGVVAARDDDEFAAARAGTPAQARIELALQLLARRAGSKEVA